MNRSPKIRRWDKELIQYVLIFFLGGFFQELLLEGGIADMTHFQWRDVPINGSFWLLLWKGSEYMVILLDRLEIHWNEQPVKRFLYTFILTVIYVVFVILFIYHLFLVVLGNMTTDQLWSQMDFGDFIPTIFLTLAIGAFMHGRAFLLQWKYAAVEVEKLKNEHLKVQYESLKNQVNPHFLFNSLNVLSELVYDNQDKAVDFIRKMSQVYRYVLDNKDQELVSLQDELSFLKSYAYLQQIRFDKNLKINIVQNQESGMIPPLSMQMLLENAIKHNIISDSKPLEVKVEIANNEIRISNNIQEKLSKDSTGIGISNLRARYHYLSDKPMQVLNDGKTFEVVLPILNIK